MTKYREILRLLSNRLKFNGVRQQCAAVPKKDISIRQAREMRSEGLTLEEIAAHIGISRRTFFRRWRDITNGEADPDTPFSRWSDS